MDLLSANDKPGEFPPSYYAATADLPAAAPPLTGSQTFDVAIVGAGYTGLSAALHLAKSGRSVALLEAHRAGFGASGRNGGQVGTGQIDPGPVGFHEVGADHRRTAERGAADLCPHQHRLVERGPIEHGSSNACRPQIGAGQVGANQQRPGEIGVRQHRTLERGA